MCSDAHSITLKNEVIFWYNDHVEKKNKWPSLKVQFVITFTDMAIRPVTLKYCDFEVNHFNQAFDIPTFVMAVFFLSKILSQ